MCAYISPLQEAAERFPQTQLWNDSCGLKDLELAIKRGASGATSNPVIVGNVLKREMDFWKRRLHEIIYNEMLEASEDEICWQIFKEVAAKGAEELIPMFEETKGLKGWQAIQVNPKFYRSSKKTIKHAEELSKINRNILVKMPVSTTGIKAIEECTFNGISINGTVCFGVPQAITVAKAVERGLQRREAKGMPIDNIHPSCTIMTGRLDDFM